MLDLKVEILYQQRNQFRHLKIRDVFAYARTGPESELVITVSDLLQE